MQRKPLVIVVIAALGILMAATVVFAQGPGRPPRPRRTVTPTPPATQSTPTPVPTATPTTTQPPVTDNDCPADDFLDVSGYQQAGYPSPELTVTCTDDAVVIESNGIPNFEFVQITPNDLQAQSFTWEIPLNPVEADQPADIPLLGAVAIAVNGLPIFGPNEAERDGYGDPYLDEILDYCNGHTAQQGMYHFHARPDCLFSDMEGNTHLVVGYALDGYPILAPYACENAACTQVSEVQSSWQRTSNVRNAWEAHEYIAGSGDLDECNGMELADGSYAYYATDTFPYFLGCYHGEADTGNGPGGAAQQDAPAAAAPTRRN